MRLRPCNLLLILAATNGCRTIDESFVREAMRRQAEQNQATVGLQQAVAAGTRELAALDADARREAVGLQRQLQAERITLAESWNELESQRQREAQGRRTDSFLTAIVQGGTGVGAALFALAAVGAALRAGGDDGDAELATWLLEDASALPLNNPRAAPATRRLRPSLPPLQRLDAQHEEPA